MHNKAVFKIFHASFEATFIQVIHVTPFIHKNIFILFRILKR
jgi:hypothetical protein